MCTECAKGNHDGCFQVLSDHPDDQCSCYDADFAKHETERAYAIAMGIDIDDGDDK